MSKNNSTEEEISIDDNDEELSFDEDELKYLNNFEILKLMIIL